MPNMNENTFAERGWRICTLLDHVTATTSGDWQPVFGFQPFTVTIEGDFAGSVQLYASNWPRRDAGPTDPDANFPSLLGVAVTTPQLITLPNAINWVKAVVTFADTPTGTCSAYAFVG